MIQNLLDRDWRGLALPLALLAVWSGVTAFEWVDIRLIVPPEKVVQAAIKYLTGKDFADALSNSLFRDLSGFAIGSLAGVLLGLLMGLSKWAERIVGPTFNTLKLISLFAWLPLISTWLGTGDSAKILFISLCAFYPVALNTFEGVRSIPRAQLDVARVYAFTRWQSITRLLVPGAAPQILTGLHLALIYAWMGTIGAEFLLVNSGPGLGDTVIKGRQAFNVELIVFGMLIIGFIGALFNHVAGRIEARALAWRGDRT
ncbi:MAG TPA: ABC transporter permease [Gallionella sp.]|nr:ABC transporter permease [Gallionella sp.]